MDRELRVKKATLDWLHAELIGIRAEMASSAVSTQKLLDRDHTTTPRKDLGMWRDTCKAIVPLVEEFIKDTELQRECL